MKHLLENNSKKFQLWSVNILHKFQITNDKQITMTKIRNLKLFRPLNIGILDLPALLNRLVRMCGTDRQCGFYNQCGHAMMIELFNRVNNLVLVI